MYKIGFTQKAQKQMEQMKKSGRKTDAERVARLLNEIKTDPKFGTGWPKPLSGHDGTKWSRHVNDKDRLVYEIYEDEGAVLVTRVLGHYKDR